MLTPEQIKLVKPVLEACAAGKPTFNRHGICHHLAVALGQHHPAHWASFEEAASYEWFKEKATEWPQFSGSRVYPVPAPTSFKRQSLDEDADDLQIGDDHDNTDPEQYSAEYWYEGCANAGLWDDEYGDSRKSLAKFWLQAVCELEVSNA